MIQTYSIALEIHLLFTDSMNNSQVEKPRLRLFVRLITSINANRRGVGLLSGC